MHFITSTKIGKNSRKVRVSCFENDIARGHRRRHFLKKPFPC